MHSAITTKLSLYDIISMVVPGGIIVGVILLSVHCLFPLNYILYMVPEWGQIVIFLIAAYLIGIINNLISEILWSKFRNNSDEIQAIYDAFDGKATNVDRSYYVIILVYYLFVTLILYHLNRNRILIIITFAITGYFFYTFYRKTSMNTYGVVKRYYEEYYLVERYRHNNAVKIIESQVAFLKTIGLPLCIASAYIINKSQCPIFKGWTIVINILSLMIIIAVAVHRQNTIYRIVIEDYKYLSNINNSNNEKK